MKIGIVILNYNSFSDTLMLVDELQRQTVAENLHIVVVDNASPNDSYAQLKPLEKQYSNVVVLQTGSNLGYAKGNNFGLKYLEQNVTPKYVAILNNDVQLSNNCFEKLVQKYENLDNPAIIAPKQFDVNHKELPPIRLNSYIDDCLSLFYVFRLFQKLSALKYKDNTGLRAMKVEIVPGSFMFASFYRFKAMGYFYPDTFLFVEERFISVKSKQMSLNNYILFGRNLYSCAF